MSEHRNPLGQPIGAPLPDWTPRPRPSRTPMEGRLTRMEPLDPARHTADLFAAYAGDREGRVWTYMAAGPFATEAALRTYLDERVLVDDPLMYVVVRKSDNKALGFATFLRIDPPAGVIEVGNIAFAPAMQRTVYATESMYLMMRRAFDELGYRRYEWKCDSLNAPSLAAAKRFGFRYEGTFRQATIYKSRNRDTAWLSITDQEWPDIRAAFERWLAPDNFDAAGKQRVGLSSLTGSLPQSRH